MKKNKVPSIILTLLLIMVANILLLIPVSATEITRGEDLDPSLYETTLDLIDYTWYTNHSCKITGTGFSNRTVFIDKNSIQYTVKNDGNTITIVNIKAPNGTNRIVIPKTVNLYSITTSDGGSTSLSENTSVDNLFCSWTSPDNKVTARLLCESFTVVSVSTTFNDIPTTAEEIIIPNSVRTINASAFANNNYVKSVYLPRVTKIEASAFGNCRYLEYIYAPELLYIESSAFADCFSLQGFDLNKVINIGQKAFCNCINIKEISLPITLQTLGNYAFAKCNSIQSLIIPKGISINKISDYAFSDCTSLKEISFPYEIVILGTGSFAHCDNLKYIDLTDSNIATIGSNAFFGSLNLQYALLPQTLTSFNSTAFDSCTSLRYVHFSNKLSSAQLSTIKKSSIASCVITDRDTFGPQAIISGNDNKFTSTIVYEPSCVVVFDQIDAASINVTYNNTETVKASKTTSTFYGYPTSAFSFNADKVGVYTIIATDILGNFQKIVVEYSDAKKINEADVVMSNTRFSYTGKDIKPQIKINGLTESVDYTISYKNNNSIGTAQMVITGKGKYYGSVTKYFTIVPKTPAGFKARTYTKTAITLQWTKDNNATGYELYRYNETTATFDLVKKANIVNYSVSSLTANTMYKFRLRTYRVVDSKTYYGNFTSILTVATMAPAPISPEAKPTSTSSIYLSWEKTPYATGYEVQQYNYSNREYVRVVTTSGNKCTIKSLLAGTTYKYRIRSYKLINNTKYYSEYTPAITITTLPQAPRVKVEPFTTSLKIKWSAVTGASYYRVYAYDAATKEYKFVTKTTDCYYVSKASPVTKYYFRVMAVKTLNSTTYMSAITTVSVITRPQAPTVTVKSSKTQTATISWSRPSGVSGYEIYMATSQNGKYTKIRTITNPATLRFTKTSLKKGTTYYFKVRTYKTVNNTKLYSSFSTIKCVKVK